VQPDHPASMSDHDKAVVDEVLGQPEAQQPEGHSPEAWPPADRHTAESPAVAAQAAASSLFSSAPALACAPLEGGQARWRGAPARRVGRRDPAQLLHRRRESRRHQGQARCGPASTRSRHAHGNGAGARRGQPHHDCLEGRDVPLASHPGARQPEPNAVHPPELPGAATAAGVADLRGVPGCCERMDPVGRTQRVGGEPGRLPLVVRPRRRAARGRVHRACRVA